MDERVGVRIKRTEPVSGQAPHPRAFYRLQSVPKNDPVFMLHQTVGNRAVERLFKSGIIQAKLKIGAPDDIYEQEADGVADQVMRMPESAIQRKHGRPFAKSPACGDEEKIQTKPISEQITQLVQREVARPDKDEDKQKVQAKPADNSIIQREKAKRDDDEEKSVQAKGQPGRAQEASPSSESVIAALQGGGQALPESTRFFFELRFGHDFSKVRVHHDDQAAESTRRVNAQAFTVGQDIVFAQGHYAPDSLRGRKLLAHELAHTIQQQGSNCSVSETRYLQRQQAQIPDWKTAVKNAEQLAAKPKDKDQAEKAYKVLIIRAAEKVPVPAPLTARIPTTADIIWSWKKTIEYAATTDPKKVDKAPDNYWKWLTFNPAAVQQDEAVTVSAIEHELDHAAHAKSLYEQWKTAPSKTTGWPAFWLSHFANWTEPEIKLTGGVLGALTGLPEKIAPSGIEFHAYVNQFVSYFHKSSSGQQAFLSKGVVFFYPLKKQTVKEKINDPKLDVSKSKQQILDYFAKPPIKDRTQQEVIQKLMAWEFRSARLFRAEDALGIKAAFKPIFDYEVDREDRKEALARYKPEAL